jgi:integrase
MKNSRPMKGNIVKRGSSWYIKLELDRDPVTGKRRQKWYSGFETKEAAKDELVRLRHQMQTGTFVEPRQTTVGEYLKMWLADYAKPNVSGKTYERYEQIVNNNLLPGLGSIPLAKLQPLQIQNLYSEQLATGRKKKAKSENASAGLSPQTVLHHHRVLRKALAQAVRWNLLVANPADRVEPPRARPQEVQPVDEAQAAWLLELAEGTRLQVPVALAIYTGMRRGEILALRWQDVDLEAGYATVCRALEFTKANGCVFKEPKSRKGRRRVSLPGGMVEILVAHLGKQNEYRAALGHGYQDNGLVVCVEDGSIWKPPAFDSSYRQLLKRRKLSGPTFHALRHSHASHLLRQGVDPKLISERLGHSKVSFTLDQYVHLLPGMQEEAAQKIEAVMKAARAKIQSTKHVS